MFEKNVRQLAVLMLCSAGLALSAQAEDNKLERVEVTGSRIKRIDAENASALQVIGREEIERSGALTATDVLRNLPAGNSGGYSTEGVTDASFGGSGISLRGLGAGSTLVLINGRRVAPFGFGSASFVDTNAIPAAAIERIETLLDGASAIYGADAIGGVINIIMRKNFDGAVLGASIGQSAYHDAGRRSVNFNWGRGDVERDGYNLFVSASHSGGDPVLANARPRTRSSDFSGIGLTDYRSSFYRAIYEAKGQYGGAFIANLPGCTPVDKPGTALHGRCVNDNTDKVAIATKHRNDGLFVAGTLRSGGLEWFGDLGLTRTEYDAPSFSYATNSYGAYTHDLRDVKGEFGNPVGGDISYLILPAGHPQNPVAGKPVAVRYLFNDVTRTTLAQTTNTRLTLGLRGSLAGWDLEGAVMSSRSRTNSTFKGLIQDSVLVNEVMDANGYVRNSFMLGKPEANDPALMARLYPTLLNKARTGTDSIDMRASRDWFSLPGGPVGVALGAELRRERFTATPDTRMMDGSIQLFSVSGSDGSRRQSAVFGELVAPITKALELSLAARVDRNSDFGSATTPKLGLKWKANSRLLLRGTYSEGFRAPTLPEMNSSRITYYSKVRDPKFCPEYKPEEPLCDRYVQVESGNNPDLKAEKSKSMTLGLVFEPWRDASLSVDFYNIKRRDEIGAITADYLLAHESSYPDFIKRNAITGWIDKLFLLTTNLAQTHTRGFDVDGRMSFKLGEAGQLQVSGNYNRLQAYDYAETPGADVVHYAGYYQQPTERFNAGLQWSRGDWSAGLTWRFTGAYDTRYTPTSNCAQQVKRPEYCRVDSWLTGDLNLSYSGWRGLQLSLSVQNIDNREAPLDINYIPYMTGFNAAYHNQLGRMVHLSARYTFK